MQINPITARKFYKTSASSPITSAADGYRAETAVGKTDTISISCQGNSQRVFGNLVRSIAGDIQALDDPARIESLRRAVSEGTYQVSADKVADAILNQVFAE